VFTRGFFLNGVVFLSLKNCALRPSDFFDSPCWRNESFRFLERHYVHIFVSRSMTRGQLRSHAIRYTLKTRTCSCAAFLRRHRWFVRLVRMPIFNNASVFSAYLRNHVTRALTTFPVTPCISGMVMSLNPRPAWENRFCPWPVKVYDLLYIHVWPFLGGVMPHDAATALTISS